MPTATRSPRVQSSRPRLLASLVLVALAAMLSPQVGSASPSQLSLIQDDRELLGQGEVDPAAAMAEIRSLGVDIVRTNVIYHKIYTSPP